MEAVEDTFDSSALDANGELKGEDSEDNTLGPVKRHRRYSIAY